MYTVMIIVSVLFLIDCLCLTAISARAAGKKRGSVHGAIGGAAETYFGKCQSWCNGRKAGVLDKDSGSDLLCAGAYPVFDGRSRQLIMRSAEKMRIRRAE